MEFIKVKEMNNPTVNITETKEEYNLAVKERKKKKK